MSDNNIIQQAEQHANSPSGGKGGLVGSIAGAVFLLLFMYFGVWIWGIKRVYVPPGKSLMLTRQLGGKENPNPDENIVVDEGFKGILKEVLGEGRHFINPVVYKRELVDTVTIEPGKMGIVTSNSGTKPESGNFIVLKGEKGILEDVYPPGRYRFNPKAYSVEILEHIEIRPGYVGCVTQRSSHVRSKPTLSGEKTGIWKEVLQPGIYYMNASIRRPGKEMGARAYIVEVVEVGYRQETFRAIRFPSKDGFDILVDVSVVWGLHPKNVPSVINKYGNIKEVVEKVIKQQVESICRLEGSKFTSKELLQGATRQKYQDAFTSTLSKECEEAGIDVQIGLVRGIRIPTEISKPLQQEKIAEEEMLTKAEQQITQTVLNELEELRADVQKGIKEIEAETSKMVAEIQAEGQKVVADISAEKELEVAKIMEEVAKLEAERERVMGKAEAEVEKMVKEAESDLFRLNVEALGTARAYELYIFARNLPDSIKFILRYAGEGTFWTDLPEVMKNIKNFSSFKILEGGRKKESLGGQR